MSDRLWFGRDSFAENSVIKVGKEEFVITEKIGTGKPGHRLWPCAVGLCQELDVRPWGSHWSVAELGCGIGLPGMVVAKKGAKVTFFDRDRDTRDWLRITLFNNLIRARVESLDWKVSSESTEQFDAIIGSELIYKDYGIPELAQFIARNWTGFGWCLLANSFLKDQPWLEELQKNKLTATRFLRRIAVPENTDSRGNKTDSAVFEYDIWELAHA